jgi:MerR family transcriptional regulator, repressor of blue light- and temperature-responsive genes
MKERYSASEVAELLNISPQSLFQWITRLNGIISIPKSEKGHRIFRQSDIDVLTKVKDMRDKGIKFEDIRTHLQTEENAIDSMESLKNQEGHEVPKDQESQESQKDSESPNSQTLEQLVLSQGELIEELMNEILELKQLVKGISDDVKGVKSKVKKIGKRQKKSEKVTS